MASLFHLPQRCSTSAVSLNAAYSADAPPILKLCEPRSFGSMPSATADCITARWTSAPATRRASS
eukprot:3952725-Pyramimonas_sp.AAC.2